MMELIIGCGLVAGVIVYVYQLQARAKIAEIRRLQREIEALRVRLYAKDRGLK